MYTMMAIAISCNKAGPQGPAGPKGDKGDTGASGAAGATGATGPQGATGTANVIYSDWITITQSQWQGIGTATITTNISVPKLTAAIRDNGVILVYHLYLGTAKLLPYAYSATGDYLDFTFVVGSITIRDYHQDGSNVAAFSNVQFRYVLMPGGVHARIAMPPPDYSDYSAVCEYYGIPK